MAKSGTHKNKSPQGQDINLPLCFYCYNRSMRNTVLSILIGVGALVLLAIGVYNIPAIHSRLAWRIDNLRTGIKYYFDPPEKAIFQPTEQALIKTIVRATMQAYQKTPTSIPVTATRPPALTATPTITPTPLPAQVTLSGVIYEDQHNRWNYCGPANFSMALRFWGWDGNRDVIGKTVKPSDKDKNVMPYEFQDYIAENVPEIGTILRMGGDIDLVKRLVSAGFPVLTEKGYYERDYTGKMGWMGHYQFITGYDDKNETLLVQDTYHDGPNFRIAYEKFNEGWRSFNYLFIVVYPFERESEVMALLGSWSNADWAARRALEVATSEVESLTGNDLFFAWFNIGSNHVTLREYVDAAIAYDQAFSLYANLKVDDSTRPYRIMWYQTWPYWAYFYTGRYTDVINLANTTLHTISEPVLEESLYWRGRAEYMIGNTLAAIGDYRAALRIHPGFEPSLQALQDLGVQP